MARGRKPKPIELRDAEGNLRRRPLPARMNVDRLSPEPPPMLGEHGRQLWQETVEQLGAAGALASIDRVVLTAYCMQWDTYMDAHEVLRKQGLFAKGSMGQLVEHPAMKAQARAAAALLKYASELAATPVARARIATERQKADQTQEFEELTGAAEIVYEDDELIDEDAL